MKITSETFGRLADGREAKLFTFQNGNGTVLKITNYGGIIVSFITPDKNGRPCDVNLGYDTLEEYLRRGMFFGALIGRYGNRIGGAKFEIDGVVYHVTPNEGNNQLHGGKTGFDKVLWDAAIIEDDGSRKLELTYLSRDGEEGFPGNLRARVLYSLSEDNALGIEYFAETDKDTVVNLTNHAYFNLGGHGSGDVLGHRVKLYASAFNPIDAESIPTGEIRPVAGTPMDFTQAKTIGEGLALEDSDEQLGMGNGFDHNFVIDRRQGGVEKAAEIVCDATGIRLEVFTDEPGVQLYSGNFLDGIRGKGGAVYDRRGAFCLETQYFPDSPNKPHFPSPILRRGGKYHFTTLYKLSTQK